MAGSVPFGGNQTRCPFAISRIWLVLLASLIVSIAVASAATVDPLDRCARDQSCLSRAASFRR